MTAGDVQSSMVIYMKVW